MTGQPDREKNMDKTQEDTGNRRQRILVFQQNGGGEKKVKGINDFGEGRFELEVISIGGSLPPIIDETSEYLPKEIEADLVLDFLNHPDLSHDLALMCQERKIPVVASGKKLRVKWALTPPT